MTIGEALLGKSLAVIGGSGLVGSHLLRAVQALRTDDTPTWCISRTPPPAARRVAGVEYLAASVLDGEAMARLPDADLAIYVAGATSNYLDDPMLTVRLSTEGLNSFLRRYSDAQRRLVVGSARIYGLRAEPTELTEKDPCVTPSPSSRNIYDGAKLVAEALAQHASSGAYPVISARLGNVYGAHGSATSTVFTDLVQQGRRARRMILTGAPSSLRNHVCGADAADGLLRALLLGRAGESYNIGAAEHLTTLEFAGAVAGAMPWAVTVEANSTAAPNHLVLSIDKARRHLSYHPNHHAAEEIPNAVRWELEHSS